LELGLPCLKMAAFAVNLLRPMKTLPLRLLLLSVLALPSAAAAQRVDPVYIEDRLNQLQQSLTVMTGQIEQLQHRNAQLQQQMEKMQADYEYRIDQLEKGKPGGPRPGGGAQAAAPAHPAPAPAAGGSGSADQMYDDAFKQLQEGDYAGAERGFKNFLQRNPQHKLAGNAQYWLGESYYARRDYQNALTSFAEGYKVYKTSPKGPDNLLKLGITMVQLGRKSDACTVFARFTQDYPRATDLQKRRIEQERRKNGCG
jgi:tol-pal system protein YbgF